MVYANIRNVFRRGSDIGLKTLFRKPLVECQIEIQIVPHSRTTYRPVMLRVTDCVYEFYNLVGARSYAVVAVTLMSVRHPRPFMYISRALIAKLAMPDLA